MAGLGTVWALAAHDLRRRLRSIVIWGVAMGVLGAVYVALYPTFDDLLEDYMQEAPELMQQYMGGTDGSLSIEQYLEMEYFGGIIPLALSFFMMIIGARAVAGREERKTLDLLMSNPISRWQVPAASLVTMALGLAAVLAIIWVLTYVAAPLAGVELSAGVLAHGLVALWPFCLVFGALGLLMSALLRRAALAIVVPAVVLIGMYIIHMLAQMSKTVEPLRVLSLQYHLGSPLGGDFPWTAFLLMLAGVCVLGGAAALAFARRDIYT